jgi:hypothetical protein
MPAGIYISTATPVATPANPRIVAVISRVPTRLIVPEFINVTSILAVLVEITDPEIIVHEAVVPATLEEAPVLVVF